MVQILGRPKFCYSKGKDKDRKIDDSYSFMELLDLFFQVENKIKISKEEKKK